MAEKIIQNITDSLVTQVKDHIVEAFEKGVIGEPCGVYYGTLDEVHNDGYTEDVICIPSPEMEMIRDTNRPSSVMIHIKYAITIFVERAKSAEAERGDNPTANVRAWELTDAVLAKVIFTEVGKGNDKYQMFTDTVVPVPHEEQTRREYTINCFVEKQTGFGSCS